MLNFNLDFFKIFFEIFFRYKSIFCDEKSWGIGILSSIPVSLCITYTKYCEDTGSITNRCTKDFTTLFSGKENTTNSALRIKNNIHCLNGKNLSDPCSLWANDLKIMLPYVTDSKLRHIRCCDTHRGFLIVGEMAIA